VVHPKQKVCISGEIKKNVDSGGRSCGTRPPHHDVRKCGSDIEVCQTGLQPRSHVHSERSLCGGLLFAEAAEFLCGERDLQSAKSNRF